jgi:hypothetical protein
VRLRRHRDLQAAAVHCLAYQAPARVMSVSTARTRTVRTRVRVTIAACRRVVLTEAKLMMRCVVLYARRGSLVCDGRADGAWQVEVHPGLGTVLGA